MTAGDSVHLEVIAILSPSPFYRLTHPTKASGYNRQSLDAVVREGLWERFESIFRNFGWDVVILKHGSLAERQLQGSEAERQTLDRASMMRATSGTREDVLDRSS
ncbi:hypothetical protein D3227_38815 [Mesorhizobium waimense]|uniref:Uncharacterized protein n=1 Tax=Mesorhizobium waimense TaxID=1300307 RepID=A0A3A5K3R7_9HYPH|nr:hypothetical protein D3227_38815 [Mesorhizobium waimense]